MAINVKKEAVDRNKVQIAARAEAVSLLARDVGGIPDIESIERREACRHSLKLFMETYNHAVLYLPWSQDHLGAIARIEEAARQGALYAFAMARGSGKTVICRHAALWAISYALRRYVFSIGANAAKAEDTLAAIKTYIRFLPTYGADFPEIAWPAAKLGGIAHRAPGQISLGKSTLMQWSNDCIVFPTVQPPANWPAHWPLRSDGAVPTSGALISASGLTGDGIRGSLRTLSTGEEVRPDMVLLDDPQSAESANSPAQNATREQLVSADVLGMAGPGRSISAVMPCTVIAQDDFVDRVLDRSKHPLWRGERTKMLKTMPTDLEAWELYFEVYRICAQKEPPDFTDSNAYYVAHREALDTGAEASWPERKLEWEVSAVQHAMHLYCRDRRAFFAEYQNDPLPKIEDDGESLVAADVCQRINRVKRGEVPTAAAHVTCFIDVQKTVLWYAVVAWEVNFTGYVADYGTFPDQNRAYFTLRDAKKTLIQATKADGVESAIFAGLTILTQKLLGGSWNRVGGGVATVGKCLIDANWGEMTELVYRWCKQSVHRSIILPSHGKGITAAGMPMSQWKLPEGAQRGNNLLTKPTNRGIRAAHYDTNFWKSFVTSRLKAGLGSKGALTLFGDRPDVHRMFADQVTAEVRVRTEGQGRMVDQWSNPERNDNHWFDGIVGNAVAASMLGVTLGSDVDGSPQKRKRLTYAEMRAQAERKQGARA